jgi:hypothetical protein
LRYADGMGPRVIALVAFAALGAAAWSMGAQAQEKPHHPQTALRFEEAFDVRHFQRGNVHTHTTRSDGTSAPEDVATWYRDHGYQFLAITDHNLLIDPAELQRIERQGFVLIPGDEITSIGGGVPVHVNGVCISHAIHGGRFRTRDAALDSAVRAVRAQGGVPIVNHPNYRWALATRDIAQVAGALFMEIWSGHPSVNNDGDARHSSNQTKWDELLALGRTAFALAVDDMHHLRLPAHRPRASLPGRGFIETFGAETTKPAICRALSEGRFYASSGPRLKRIAIDGSTLTVWVEGRGAKVEFIGEGGKVLASKEPQAGEGSSGGFPVAYTLHGDEMYVRAKVTENGASAWTQAYRAR